MNDMKIQEKAYVNLQLQSNKKIKERGITLIALVVTIIILLILVGVTISQIIGENGLIKKAKEAVEKYKNASEEELIQLGQLEQYVRDFEIIGGDEGEDKASVSGVEYKISSEEEWTEKENEGTVKEGTEGDQKETEYTHIFEKLDLGKSYYIRVKVYDTNNKYIEAISDVVTLSYVMTATEEDVLEGRTYLTEEGTLKEGAMKNNVAENEVLQTGGSYTIPKGYHSGERKSNGRKTIK